MNEDLKLRGIRKIFDKLLEEEGVGSDVDEDSKESVADKMDCLFGPVWRYEVLIHTPQGGDLFGGGWKPFPPLMSHVSPSSLDRMYHRMRKFARDRGMPEELLVHFPREASKEYFDNKDKGKHVIPRATEKTTTITIKTKV